jgi:hypothetical protein
MKLSSRRSLLAGTVTGTVVLAGLMSTVPAIAAVPTDAFSAVTPTRILDTRTGTGQGGVIARVGAGASITLHVADAGPLPHTMDAVVMNVTAVKPTASTFVTVYPGNLGSPPAASNINVAAGRIVANLVTVPVDSSGDVKLFNAAGSVDLLADVSGYYSGSATDTFNPLTPSRILDTRVGIGPLGPVGPGQTIDAVVANSGGVPANASAVVLNVTATNATSSTLVAVYPTPVGVGTIPTISNLNVLPGQAAANLVTVAIGVGGDVRFANAAGDVQIIADVQGYFTPDASGSLYTPVTPTRLLDSRGNAPTPTKESVGPGGVIDLNVADGTLVPADATAALFNYTAVGPSLATFVQAYPAPSSGTVVPLTSNINVGAHETRANLVSAQLGAGGDVRLRNQAGTTDMLVDLAGYYTNAGNPNVPGPPPTGAPGHQGVTVTGTFEDVHPGQYGKVSLNVTTNVDAAPLSATALLHTGASKISTTSTAGVAVPFVFGVGTSLANVPVAIVLSATSSALQATATGVVYFTPVAISCRAAANPANPPQHTNVDIVVATPPGANITAIFHYKATTASQSSKADKTGRGDVIRNIGGATVAFRVPVTVTVTLGPKSATCSTAFTTIA